MKAGFYTLGCKVNQYETRALQQMFFDNGYEIVDFDSVADVYVINSCTVTSQTDTKTKQVIRRKKKNNPSSVLILTGCYPQGTPEAMDIITQADIITGAKNRSQIIPLLNEFLETKKRIVSILPHTADEKFEKMNASSFYGKTRAFVKIEDGCDRFCTYCIIPKARGKVRSKPLIDIKTEIESLGALGYSEVVLAGINLSSYGKDLNLSFADAVEVACSVDSIKRVRLGSLEPDLITDEVLERFTKMDKLCPQFHLSLQSGCDKTLKEMNRRYTTHDYIKVVEKIRSLFENASITTDIMVGFPGETEEDFKESMDFAQKIGFLKMHVFAYSKREGTVAASRTDQISKLVKDTRRDKMTNLSKKMSKDFYNSQIEKKANVLFELGQTGLAEGYTENYTPVTLKTEEKLQGKIIQIKIIDINNTNCIGVID